MQEPPLIHGFGSHSFVPLEHVLPLKPALHLHLKVLIPSVQVPMQESRKKTVHLTSKVTPFYPFSKCVCIEEQLSQRIVIAQHRIEVL